MDLYKCDHCLHYHPDFDSKKGLCTRNPDKWKKVKPTDDICDFALPR